MRPGKLNLTLLLLMLVGLLAVSGCNTTDFSDGLADNRTTSNPTPVQDVNPETPPPSNQTALVQEAPENDNGEQIALAPTDNAQNSPAAPLRQVSFLPVTGAPQRAVTSLTAALKSSAQKNAIQLIPSNLGTTRYKIKGYFSALNDGSGTLVVYVWDVLNSEGKRIHRISGQQRTGRNDTDPWAAISEAELRRVADDTMARLSSYLNRG